MIAQPRASGTIARAMPELGGDEGQRRYERALPVSTIIRLCQWIAGL